MSRVRGSVDGEWLRENIKVVGAHILAKPTIGFLLKAGLVDQISRRGEEFDQIPSDPILRVGVFPKPT